MEVISEYTRYVLLESAIREGAFEEADFSTHRKSDYSSYRYLQNKSREGRLGQIGNGSDTGDRDGGRNAGETGPITNFSSRDDDNGEYLNEYIASMMDENGVEYLFMAPDDGDEVTQQQIEL